MKQKNILFGVLNWGLGHATRSEIIIDALLKEGFNPIICSDGEARIYLEKRFPKLAFEELPSYHIRYSQRMLLLKMMWQLPTLYRTIKLEHLAVFTLVNKYKPLGVISDSRIGFYSDDLPSVYISHQLEMPLPFYLDPANLIHRGYIEKYTECWVPDFQGKDNLAAKLSRQKLKIPKRYLGPLSRFLVKRAADTEKKFKAVAILSGPEPQRSILQKKILKEFKKNKGPFALVRGRADRELYSDDIHIIDMAGPDELRDLIEKSELVISRSGYSSIMDYYYLGNKALLIPTPGQPEQEYLARYHCSKGHFHCIRQSHLNLEKDIPKALDRNGIGAVADPFLDWKTLFELFEGK